MLKLSQKQTLNQLELVIQSQFSDELTGHDFAHIKRVVNLTTRFVSNEINEFVALSIAYLHDVFDDKINKVDNLEKALLDYFDKHKLNFEGFEDEIILGVSQIGYKGGFGVKDKIPEATLVSDADYLDAIGAIGIARTFYYAGSKNTPLFIPNTPTGSINSLDEYRKESAHALAHFDDKLLKLNDLIVSKKARELAQRRHKMLQLFYKEFMLEMDESK